MNIPWNKCSRVWSGSAAGFSYRTTNTKLQMKIIQPHHIIGSYRSHQLLSILPLLTVSEWKSLLTFPFRSFHLDIYRYLFSTWYTQFSWKFWYVTDQDILLQLELTWFSTLCVVWDTDSEPKIWIYQWSSMTLYEKWKVVGFDACNDCMLGCTSFPTVH